MTIGELLALVAEANTRITIDSNPQKEVFGEIAIYRSIAVDSFDIAVRCCCKAFDVAVKRVEMSEGRLSLLIS